MLSPNDLYCFNQNVHKTPCRFPDISDTPHNFDIVYTMYFNISYCQSGWKWYSKQMFNMQQSILSVREVGFNGTIHVLLGGEQRQDTLNNLKKMTVNILFLKDLCFPLPKWANLYHRPNFQKTCVLSFSAHNQNRILHIDNDMIAFNSLEYLYWISSTPAFVVKPREGINSGVMLLQETKESAREKIKFYNTVKAGGNGGEQHLVNEYYKHFDFTELPTKYNTYSYDINKNISKWWTQIVLWHKPGDKWGRSYSKNADQYVKNRFKKLKSYFLMLS